ncbi:MAG: hypothetical protein HUU38_14955 [Anaerolineales bacterium]|nr:hypothetical protein [Anaerolineales bacterium]
MQDRNLDDLLSRYGFLIRDLVQRVNDLEKLERGGAQAEAAARVFSTYALMHGARMLLAFNRQPTTNILYLSDLLYAGDTGYIRRGGAERGVEGLFTYGIFDGVDDFYIGNINHSSYYYSLTIIAWVRFHADAIGAGSTMGIYTFWRTSTAARAFNLRKNANDKLEFLISNDGTAEYAVESASAVVADQWYFVAAQFDPNVALHVWLSNPATKRLDKSSNSTGIPAGIVAPVPAGQPEIGARNSAAGVDTDYLKGDIGMIWTGGHVAATPEPQIQNAFRVSRPLLGL